MKKIAFGIIVFLVILVVAAPFLIPTKFISDKISAAVEESLHKKTVIESVRISILPRLGVRVSGLQIGTPKTDDFYVSLDSLFVALEWKPLLKKQVSVSELSINKPLIEMYATKTETPQPTTEKSTAKTDTGGAELNIRSLKINDATFTMFDQRMKPSVHVAGLSEDLSFNYSANGTASIDGTTIIPTLAVVTPMGELGRNMRIEIKKNLEANDKNLNIKELKINLGSLPIALEGFVNDYSSENPDVDLKFSGGPSDIDNIIGLVPANMLPSDIKGVESKGNLLVQGHLKGKINTAKAAQSIQASNFGVNISLSNGMIKHPTLPWTMNNIGFAIVVDPKVANVKNFNVDFGQSHVQYSAVISNYFTQPTFTFETNTNLNLSDIQSLKQDIPVKDLKGLVTLAIKAAGSASQPENAQLNGSVQAQNISLKYPEFKYDVERVNSSIKLEKNNIVLQSVSMLINGSDITASGRIDNPMAMMNTNKNSLVKFVINASSKNLDADKLMPPPSEEEEATVLPPEFFKLDGDIKATIQKLTFNKLAMTNAVGNIGVHKGLVTFDPLSVKTFGGTISMAGNVNLQNRKKPTFDLDTQLSNIAVDKALAYADNINKLLKLDNSLKADIGLKAKSKGELTKTFDLNIASLDSVGSFSLNNGSIQNHPIQKAFSKYFKSDQFDKINIKQWTQAFSVEKGKLNVNNLNFGAKDFMFNINGWQSLEGKNDFAIDAKLPPSLTSKITDKLPAPIAALVGNQKQMTLPFLVSGETASPSLGLNNQKLSGEAKEQLTNQLKDESNKLTQDLKSDAKSKLQGLVGGAKEEPKDTKGKKSTKKSAPKKQDVKQDVKDKLKKLF